MLTEVRNVPIGGLACGIILIFLQLHGAGKENRQLPLRIKLQHLDFGGATTLIAGVACLLIALQWAGHSKPWRSAEVIGLFIGFGLLIVVFGLIQWKRGERATIPLRIIRQRSILLGCLYVAFLDMSAYAVCVLVIVGSSLTDFGTVCLLHTLLLSRSARCLNHSQWSPLPSHGVASNCGNSDVWCVSYPVWLLCKSFYLTSTPTNLLDSP